MYKEADEALYVSKENGKNQYTVFGSKVDANTVLSHHQEIIFCLTKNRLVNELLSSISIDKYGYLLLGSLQELDSIKEEFKTKKCILIVDISAEPGYQEIIDHMITQEETFPTIAITQESNMEQMFAFSKMHLADLITYPVSKHRLCDRVEKAFAKIENN